MLLARTSANVDRRRNHYVADLSSCFGPLRIRSTDARLHRPNSWLRCHRHDAGPIEPWLDIATLLDAEAGMLCTLLCGFVSSL
jgi:hypothetical protein